MCREESHAEQMCAFEAAAREGRIDLHFRAPARWYSGLTTSTKPESAMEYATYTPCRSQGLYGLHFAVISYSLVNLRVFVGQLPPGLCIVSCFTVPPV